MAMTINPYLNFNGNCAEAFRFYAETLGGKDLHIMTFRDSPMAGQVTENEKNMVSKPMWVWNSSQMGIVPPMRTMSGTTPYTSSSAFPAALSAKLSART